MYYSYSLFNSSTVSWPCFSRISPITTLAPRSTKAIATALPIPRLPPVTTVAYFSCVPHIPTSHICLPATLPSKDLVILISIMYSWERKDTPEETS